MLSPLLQSAHTSTENILFISTRMATDYFKRAVTLKTYFLTFRHHWMLGHMSDPLEGWVWPCLGLKHKLVSNLCLTYPQQRNPSLSRFTEFVYYLSGNWREDEHHVSLTLCIVLYRLFSTVAIITVKSRCILQSIANWSNSRNHVWKQHFWIHVTPLHTEELERHQSL